MWFWKLSTCEALMGVEQDYGSTSYSISTALSLIFRKLLVAAVTIPTLLTLSLSAYAADPIKIGAIYDLTGDLNIYGIAQSRALHLAVDEINSKGGLLGRPVEVIESDAQSAQAKYTQYANTLIMRDHISALFAGLTSSAREAIRPLVRRADLPYFYSSLYEGGVCDKQTFVTGPSASQQLSVLIPWAIKAFGPRLYVMAPDYNFGTISAEWIHTYAVNTGGNVVGTDFLPLTATDYSSTIQKIQLAKPNVVVALPVGANQTGFLGQFVSAGLQDKIALVSTNYGSGNQQIIVSTDVGRGIVVAPEYVSSIATAENTDFKARWKVRYKTDEPIIGVAVDVWNAVQLWATAVQKAHSVQSASVITALESGISIAAPNGPIMLDPRTHHLVQNIYLARGNTAHDFDIIETHEAVKPAFETKDCDLIAKPETAAHFKPSDF
jgi:urea transport system substrate-binding protein